jgi:ParB family chromosome partitioning protein
MQIFFRGVLFRASGRFPAATSQGFQRLLELPGYDAATLAEKTGKSESLIYFRLALLHLIPDVGRGSSCEEASIQPRRLAKHAFSPG